MVRKNPTSSIRSGFDYQDLWTLKLCGEWLLDPDKYRWIQIEINPTESNKFYLDDIGLLDKGEHYHFYQVKFKDNTEYQWNWDDFLMKRKGKTGELPSLFDKWATSFKKIDYTKILKAVFVTNGSLSDDVKKFLINDKINIKKLRTKNPVLYNQIKAEIGNDNFTEIFFQKFKFLFENRSKKDVERAIREVFYDEIRATRHGVNNLYLELKNEASNKRTIHLMLDQIREWCEFDKPKPLNERLEVPSDFQFFDKTTHESIFKDLQSYEGGIKIIHGKPGTGKSVYLSRLSKDLKEKGLVVIKHYYHINPSDSSSFERLNSNRVIEAIKAQFKSSEYKEYLGDLANKNSREIPLSEFISLVSKNLSRDGKSFVIIIDGLDHVVKEKDAQELKDFLDEVFYPQKGLWIIFGMQPQIKNETILQSIFNKCSEKDWIEIKGLNKEAVINLIKENATNLNLPDDHRIFGDLVSKLYEITQGYPLHLRYILAQLKNRLDNKLVTEYECRDLIPCGGIIEKYYTSLWDTLDESTKTFLLTFISVDFQFTRKQFIECTSSFSSSPTSITRSFKKIEHLITSDSRDRLRVYHNSFKVFLYERAEWKEQRQVIKEKVKEWLENSEYENLKWAELRKLDHELGNDGLILELDRKWLIDSIIYPRNSSQIESQLELAARVAFSKNDFARTLKISHLHTYYKNAQDFVEEAAKLIWIESIKSNPYFIDELILSELPSDVLVIIVDIASQYGKFYIIDEIIDILRQRLDYQEYRTGEIPSVTKAILKVIPYDRKHESRRVFDYIVQFRDIEISSALFKLYVEKLLSLDQKTKTNELLQFDLNEEEKKAVLECCVKYDLKQKSSEFIKTIQSEKNNSPLEQAYLILQGKKLPSLPELPNRKSFSATIPEYGSERAKWIANFHSFFFLGIIYGLCDEQKKIEEWISSALPQWPAQATIALFKSALKIADTIQKVNKIEYQDIFNELKTLPDLKWPEDRDRLDFKIALNNAVTKILKDILLIKLFLNDSLKIDKENYKNLTSTPFFLQNDLFEFMLEIGQPILEKEVYNVISGDKITNLENTINYFPERSEEYVKLASFSKMYQENERAKDLLLNAADNFLGYGYHNDIYLFDVLEAIEFCAEAGIDAEKIDNWTHRIIPLIANVGEYTDGDETNHLPNSLADFLSKNNKKLLFKFYFDQADKEELYPAQDRFKYIISSLAFTEDTEMALATTALDKESFRALKEKTRISRGAQVSLNIIQEYLGEINYKDENYSSPSDFEEKKIDYTEVTPEKLEEHLGKMKSKWDFERYIVSWAKHWLGQGDEQKIYNLIKSISLKNANIKSISGEILDILYPLAYEFENDEAFRFLYYAQINDHGWARARYWTDKKKAVRRWDFIREKYPKRYLEFFKSSINYSIPLSRGVEFFCRFSDLDKAEAITGASIDFAEDLMADLNLHFPDWAQGKFQEVNELDLLFQRLVWPSPLVRERAATAIGNLLVNSSKKEGIYKRLLEWISNWKIESIIAIGLLPIIKAFQICKDRNDLTFIKIEDIVNSVQINSIVIEELLSKIASQTGEQIKKSPAYISPRKLPDSYELNNFFNKYIKTILAPIYFIRAKEVEENTKELFIKLWAYNAEVIAKGNNIRLESNHYFYGYHENDKFLTGFSTKVSEVYRSAFLRVLHDLYNKGFIKPNFYMKYAFATLPVDLSFWKILPNRAPKWWPRLIDYKISNEKSEITKIQFREPIENIIRYKGDDNIIIAAEGAVEPERGWKENSIHSFSLIGFGYKVIGANLPNPGEVAKKILNIPQTLLALTKIDYPLCFLENNTNFDINSNEIQVKDLVIFPLITRNRCLTISLWQYFKEKNQSFNINERLRLKLQVVIKKDKWVYEDENSNEVVKFFNWLEGLQERYEFEAPIPYGQYLEISKKFLNDWLDNERLRLGYLLNVSYGYRKYSHDEIKYIDNFKLFNVSKIIVPK